MSQELFEKRFFNGMVMLPYGRKAKQPDSTTSSVPGTSGQIDQNMPQSNDQDQDMPDVPEMGDNASPLAAAPVDPDTTTTLPTAARDSTAAPRTALALRTNLRSHTQRQAAQVATLPVLGKAVTRREGSDVPRMEEFGYRQAHMARIIGVVEHHKTQNLGESDPFVTSGQNTSSQHLGLPLKIFQSIAEYVLLYEQPEELVRKFDHRRMAEVTRAHVLTVSSGKVVRKPPHKEVARNLNTASATNFFLVCHGFRDVGIPIYYGKNTFKFSSEQNFQGWARTIATRRKYVRSIQLDSHRAVRFKDKDIRPEALEMVCDYGMVHTTLLSSFPNLEDVHLTIGCALPWQHNAFPNHGNVDPAIEGMCWGYAIQQANYMLDSLSSELQSPTINIHRTLIFDGTFVHGRTNEKDYRERMEDFGWKLREFEYTIPPALTGPFSGLLPLLLDAPKVITPPRTGAWSQKLNVEVEDAPVVFNKDVGVPHCVRYDENGQWFEAVIDVLPARR